MSGPNQPANQELREKASAEGWQLFILVRPNACPVCAMHRSKVYWADEAPILPMGGCLHRDCQCEYRLSDPSGPTLDEMLANSIAAVKKGQMEEAQEWLVTLLQIDRYNEQGWIWLSGAADNDQDRLDCLQEALKINPDNVNARRGLRALHAKGVGAPPPSVSPTET